MSMLVWMDLEMTGLDHTSDVIVEIATIVTDAELEVIAEGPQLVIHASEEQLAAMVPVVREMHTKSGLLPEIRASTTTVAEAEKATLIVAYTHGQPAQPTTFGHYLAAAIEVLLRDAARLDAAIGGLEHCPMGAAAITTSDTDRMIRRALTGPPSTASWSLLLQGASRWEAPAAVPRAPRDPPPRLRPA